ncbi:MAG: glycosyl hydrolase family 65 protein, partial [Flavobacteriales bacterium]
SEDKQKYVMLGVTGPNEYENNVNNNWYTNYIAKWCLSYALHCETMHASSTGALLSKDEIEHWSYMIQHIYFPTLEGTRIFLQQDGFMDKEQRTVADIPMAERPINQHWSWDRILRSIFIKQADVLQGLYLFEEHFDLETLSDNFDFYEPKTVHESSLSPCIHVVIAAKIQQMDKAYALYLRTSRLDLDDYNHEADEGLHITSMAGTWLSLVEGFAGVRINENGLSINPSIPAPWKKYAFQILYKNQPLKITIEKTGGEIENKSSSEVSLTVNNKEYTLLKNEKITF